MLKYIVKAGRGCNGDSCRLCDDYLPGFYNSGRIMIVDVPGKDLADLAASFCPMQIIEIEQVENKHKS